MTTTAEQLNTSSLSNKQMSSKLVANITTPKALAGILLVLFGLYQLYTALPDSWSQLSAANDQVQQFEEKKKIVTQRLEQLRSTDKNLGKASVEIYQLQPSQTPQLATLAIAQDVLKIAEATGNKLVSITPSEMRTLNYDKVVDIPIESDTPNTTAAAPSSATTVAPTGGAAPATPATPQPSDTTATGNPQTALQCAEYQLTVNGSVQTIVQFIYKLLDYKTALFIEKVSITADGSGITQGPSSPSSTTASAVAVPKAAVPTAPSIKLPGDASSKSGSLQEPAAKPLKPEVVAKGNLVLNFTFLIPWKPVGSN